MSCSDLFSSEHLYLCIVAYVQSDIIRSFKRPHFSLEWHYLSYTYHQIYHIQIIKLIP